jgi:hypothetical protein
MAHAHTNPARVLGRCIPIVLALTAAVGTARAADWTSSFEAIFMDVYGHDPHVLTILETDPGSVATRTGVALETESKLAYRGEFQYQREVWGLGIDFSWITTGQQLDRSAAATGAAGDVLFEVAGATFTSSAPGENLYFQRLEDTDLNAWAFDLYAMRRLSGSAASGVAFRFGLRVADFDNDFRAAAGIEGVRGLRIDASSNYGALRGPLIGLTGRFERGHNVFEASIGQSVVFGEAELSNRRRMFTGSFSEEPDPAFVSDGTFRMLQDVAIPMTDLRLEWKYRLGRMVALGLSANASTWWNVSVPPGVVPAEGSAPALHENTLVFSGVGALVEISY